MTSSPALHLVVLGVSGAGKTVVGTALAERLDLPFRDGDDLHTDHARAKMSAGEALDDEDRWPWLEQVGEWLADQADGGVVACSALKRSYRDLIRTHCPTAYFVHLHGDEALLTERQQRRKGHFMPSSLMASQLATLEPLQADEPGTTVDVTPPVDDIVQELARALRS